MGSCSREKGAELLLSIHALVRKKHSFRKWVLSPCTVHLKSKCFFYYFLIVLWRSGVIWVCSFVELGTTSTSLGCKSFSFSISQTMKVRTACKWWPLNEWQLSGVKVFISTSQITKVRATWKVTYLGAKVFFAFCKVALRAITLGC
jgi:hypothetical protein